jgi:hypothetical protein
MQPLRDLPMVATFARSADAKETAIVCLSAALLFASLAVLALATERSAVGISQLVLALARAT